MSGINKVILVGWLGKDPDIRTFEQGNKKASFTLATSETRKDKDGKRYETTEWHNIYCWRSLAEIAEKYLAVGKMIYLEGKLHTRSYEDKGIKRYITEIEATSFTILSPKREPSEAARQTPNKGGQIPAAPADAQPDDCDDEDIPF